MEIWSTENVGPGPIFFLKIGSDWTDIFEKIGPTLKMDPDLYYFLALYRIMHKDNKITKKSANFPCFSIRNSVIFLKGNLRGNLFHEQ